MIYNRQQGVCFFETTGIINYPHFFHMKAICQRYDMNILGQIVPQHWENTYSISKSHAGIKICNPNFDHASLLSSCPSILFSRWWFQLFFIFTPNLGEDSHFDEHIFQMGWFNHQPDIGFVFTSVRNVATNHLESNQQTVGNSQPTSRPVNDVLFLGASRSTED